MSNIIQYGIGKDYLPNWGVNEALREIYQNFLDYGKFKQRVVNTIRQDNDWVHVTISNDFVPENLEFFQIGKSMKGDNKEAIGQHGEGLKMAMLVFLRLNYGITVYTKEKNIIPIWGNQNLIGETLGLSVTKNDTGITKFTIKLFLPKAEFDEFNNNMIRESDIIFSHPYHGDIVNKPVGNLYSGRLFVCHVKNFKKSYNLSPSVLKLDRDRRVPGAFETSYHTSKINQAQEEFNFVDQDYDDMKYVSEVPKKLYPTIKPKVIGNNIEFVAKVGKEEVVIKNESIKSHLKEQSYFSKAINGIKKFLVSKMGITELLINFRKKYCHSTEAQKDFDIILEKLGINIDFNDSLF